MSSTKPYQIRTIHVREPWSAEGFTTEYGNDARKMATLCFFCGAGITHLLDRIVHRIGAWQKKKSATTRNLSETPQGDTSQGDFITETMERRYAEGEFGEPPIGCRFPNKIIIALSDDHGWCSISLSSNFKMSLSCGP